MVFSLGASTTIHSNKRYVSGLMLPGLSLPGRYVKFNILSFLTLKSALQYATDNSDGRVDQIVEKYNLEGKCDYVDIRNKLIGASKILW